VVQQRTQPLRPARDAEFLAHGRLPPFADGSQGHPETSARAVQQGVHAVQGDAADGRDLGRRDAGDPDLGRDAPLLGREVADGPKDACAALALDDGGVRFGSLRRECGLQVGEIAARPTLPPNTRHRRAEVVPGGVLDDGPQPPVEGLRGAQAAHLAEGAQQRLLQRVLRRVPVEPCGRQQEQALGASGRDQCLERLRVAPHRQQHPPALPGIRSHSPRR